MSRYRRSSTIGLAALLLVLVAALAIGVYTLQDRGYRLDDALETVVDKSADAATVANVKTALALSRRVSAFDIDVDAESGTVTLTGAVPSESVKELAGSTVAPLGGVAASTFAADRSALRTARFCSLA